MSSLPIVDQSVLPADVRSASKADRDKYVAGLGFERQLVEQLTQQLAKTASLDGSSSDGGSDDDASTGTNPYASLLPSSMADALQQQGGLGLARQLAGLPAHLEPEAKR